MSEGELQYCVNVCWSCRHANQQALYNWYLVTSDVAVDPKHLRLMTDCIQILQLAADYMTRASDYSDEIRKVCAIICDDCAASCEKFEHEYMLRCAELCRKCARYCRGEF